MKYSELWAEIKSGKLVEIQLDKSQHKKTLRRFRHESHKDRGFRLVCAESDISYRFVTASLGNLLFIRLEFISRTTLPKGFL